jgi:murein DD-endopeptidase MepM/ murein hydrolase activator NlpD
MKKAIKKLSHFLIFFFVIAIYFLLPTKAQAQTTPYRSAGWVGTESTGKGYTDVTGCQESNDGLYCLRPSSLGGGSSNLFFSAFGRLEDFNIPLNSEINRVLIKVKGRSSTSLAIGVIDKYKHTSNSDLCSMKRSSDWVFGLGASADKIIEYNTSIVEQELDDCINPRNINFHNLTFRIRGLSTSNWFAEIDNFEIAFDYTPPAVTPKPVEFPENQKGTVWEIGPDKSNLRKVEGLEDVVSVETYDFNSIALKSDGTVWTWGKNDSGQLGNGTTIDSSEPVQVKGPDGEGFLSEIIAIDVGRSYGLALKSDGTVWTWGDNTSKHRGLDNDSEDVLVYPAQIQSAHLYSVIAISAGDRHSLALNSDGSVVAWGLNSSGQLGNNCSSCNKSVRPIKLNTIVSVKSIAAGGFHSLALKDDGSVWGWGDTGLGQLAESGFNFNSNKIYSPIQLIELSNIKKISSRHYYNQAIDNLGIVLEWGANGRVIKVPELVEGITNASNIFAGLSGFSYGVTGYAIRSDGTLWELYINDIPAKQVNFPLRVTSAALGTNLPSLAVVNSEGDVLGESDVAPFLRLPWDYEGQNRKFEDIVYDPESWFDHKYPLQNIDCCVFEVFKFDGNEIADAYRSHSGYDYASRNGVVLDTPVLAAADGIATFRPEAKTKGAGNEIKIDHGNGYQTWYQHLSLDGLAVSSEGSAVEVKKGQQIGLVGMSGATNGPHIHFSVFKDENENGNFGDDYPFGLTDPLGWDGDNVDPWTEYDVGGRKGVKSFKLFEKLQKSKKEAVSVNGGEIERNFLELRFPSGWTALNLAIEIKDGSFESQSPTFRSVAPSFFITAVNSLGEKVTEFLKPVVIIYNYANVDLTNIEEESLKIMHYNPTSRTWTELVSEIDMNLKKITAETSSFSQFALMGELKDAVAPTTEIALDGDSGEENVFRSSVSVSFVAVDNEGGFGIKDTIYGINDEDWNYYLEPFIFEIEGEHKISYQSSDLVGNVEDVKTQEFLIDKTAPVSSVSIEGQEGENGWYVGNPIVTISSEDSLSGIDKIEYSTDNGDNYQSYSNPFEIETEGITEILYRAFDKAGNLEEAKTAEVKLDKSAPVSRAYISGLAGSAGWFRSSVSLELSGSDAVSGYDNSFYSIDGGESFTEYTDTVLFTNEGEHKVVYYSVDKAGNKEDEKIIVFNIDKTAPIVKISVNPDTIWPPNGKLVPVKVDGSVAEENLLETKLAVRDEYGKVEPVLSEFGQSIKLEAKRNGNDRDGRVYTIGATSEDLAGNTGNASTQVLVPHDRR